jgi:hypothetical protein
MQKHATSKYLTRRLGLLRRGTNIKRWAEARGYPVTTVYDALKGSRLGIQSVKIVREVEEFIQ